jgi:hypothetical protein
MESSDSSFSWAQAFLHGTVRGRALLDELTQLERCLAMEQQGCRDEDYRRVADCWLRIVEAASEYAALSTARHYTSVLRRFQSGMHAVMAELGRGLDALAPLLQTGAAGGGQPPPERRARHHLQLIDCRGEEHTQPSATGSSAPTRASLCESSKRLVEAGDDQD